MMMKTTMVRNGQVIQGDCDGRCPPGSARIGRLTLHPGGATHSVATERDNSRQAQALDELASQIFARRRADVVRARAGEAL
jgi:hypothetical protein